jgi:hypothetical protein
MVKAGSIPRSCPASAAGAGVAMLLELGAIALLAS